MSQGIAPGQLSDEDLDRELAHLHETRRETFFEGTQDALRNHTVRMLELEDEFRRRFPERTTASPLRTRPAS